MTSRRKRTPGYNKRNHGPETRPLRLHGGAAYLYREDKREVRHDGIGRYRTAVQ